MASPSSFFKITMRHFWGVKGVFDITGKLFKNIVL